MWIECTKCKRYLPLYCFAKRKNGAFSIRKQCKPCLSSTRKKWNTDNKDKHKVYYKRYYDNNTESILKRKKQWQKDNKDYITNYYQEHKEAYKERAHKHYIENKESYRVRDAKRRLKEKEQELTKQELEDIRLYYTLSNYLSSFGIPYEVDHIIPLSKGGRHHASNLQVITRTDNRSKGAKEDYEYHGMVYRLKPNIGG